MFNRWLKERVEARKAALYSRGYDYAAGRLLREGDLAVAALEAESDGWDNNAFDDGLRAALDAYERKNRVSV